MRPENASQAEEAESRAASADFIHIIDDTDIDCSMIPIIEAAARGALQHQQAEPGAELTLALVTAENIRALNRQYRGIDSETDVLSFGMQEGVAMATPPEALRYLGDVAINVSRAYEQAHEYGHTAEREFAYLTVHGVLHLMGHDHHSQVEAQRMRAAEEEVLARLHLPRVPA